MSIQSYSNHTVLVYIIRTSLVNWYLFRKHLVEILYINFTNPSKINTVIYSDIVNLYAQYFNMFTDLFIKYKRKYSVLDRRINKRTNFR